MGDADNDDEMLDEGGRSIVTGRLTPGHKLGGRPVGARDKLTRKVLAVALSDFDKHGVDFLRKLRTKSPAAYARFIARLLPAQIEISNDGESIFDRLPQGGLEALVTLTRFVREYPTLLPKLLAAAQAEERGEVVTVQGEVVARADVREIESTAAAWTRPEVAAELLARTGSKRNGAT